VSDGADWTSAGRLFQSRGPAATKERSPTQAGGRREDWRSTSAAGLDLLSADQRRTAAGLTSTEVHERRLKKIPFSLLTYYTDLFYSTTGS